MTRLSFFVLVGASATSLILGSNVAHAGDEILVEFQDAARGGEFLYFNEILGGAGGATAVAMATQTGTSVGAAFRVIGSVVGAGVGAGFAVTVIDTLNHPIVYETPPKEFESIEALEQYLEDRDITRTHTIHFAAISGRHRNMK